MPISKERLAALIAETEIVEKAFTKFREEIARTIGLEKTDPSSREGLVSILQYSLDTNPVPALPRKEVEKHHYFLTRKQNEKKKLHARRKRAGETITQQQTDRLRQSRIPQEDFDIFMSEKAENFPPKGGGSPSDGVSEVPSADEGFPALDVEDL